jgi:subtilisin family serine protease
MSVHSHESFLRSSSGPHQTKTIWSRRIVLRTALLLAVVSLLLLSFLAASALGAGVPAKERVMVVYAAGALGRAAADQAIRETGGTLMEWVPGTNIVVALVPQQALAGLARSPAVLAIEPDARVQTLGESSGIGRQGGGLGAVAQSAETIGWNITRIGAETAWTLSVGRDVNVAVLDTGIDLDHPDLLANIEGGYMAIQTGPYSVPAAQTYNDDNNHGTHVAGIIAATKSNGVGVVGVAPEADLYAVKVLDMNGSGYLSDIIEGIRWIIGTRSDANPDNDIQIINMSFGTTTNSWFLEDALIDAESAGIMLVAAAGNNGPATGTVLYPAAYPSVVAVGATDQADAIASFSSRGPQVELSAPGVSILSSIATGEYAVYSGTSMASPHVAGAAALLLQANPQMNPIEVTVSLGAYADDLGPLGRDTSFGFGLVRPDLSLGLTTPPEPNTAPTASDEVVSSAEDAWVTFVLDASDAEGDTLTYSITQPGHGTATLDGTGPTVTYTPAPNYNGEDTFTFQAYDGQAYSNTATVSVTVTPVNDAPVAQALSLSTTKDTSVSATLTGSDVDGDPLTFHVATGPSHGTLALNSSTGAVIYSPAAGFVGGDSFTFVVNDGAVDSSSAAVSVSVTQPPATTMHISDITVVIKKAGKIVGALATVTIVDGLGRPLAGVVVSGYWTGATRDRDSGTTNTLGQVTLASDKTKTAVSGVTTFTFTVDNVTLSGWVYDSSANEVTSDSVIYVK